MNLKFVTPTTISLIDITSMGDSGKRGDESKIGMFDSGLKYALALLLRADVKVTIKTKEKEYVIGSSTLTSDGKSKEVISVWDGEVTHMTGFAKALGFNWELWQAYRELFSNMVDEGGYELVGDVHPEDYGTVVDLEFTDLSPFYEVFLNRLNYTLVGRHPIYTGARFDVYENKGEHLKVFKQGILVYENSELKSHYIFNLHFGELDERRILRDVSEVGKSLCYKIANTEDEGLIKLFVSEAFEEQGYWLTSGPSYGGVSDTVAEYVYKVYEEKGVVSSFKWLISAVKDRKDCRLPGRKIENVGDHVWQYYNKVSIESVPQSIEKSLGDEIEHLFNINLEGVEIKQAQIKGEKAIADKFNSCIIVSEDFDIQEDFPRFLVQWYDLTRKGNIINEMAKDLTNFLKK